MVVLENIYRHLEMGEPPRVAAETGGKEVALPVLASTLTTAVVFFPVTLLAGVSKFLFSAMALAVVVSLFASYIVAMTVVPLFCARYLKLDHAARETPSSMQRPDGARASTRLSMRHSIGCCGCMKRWSRSAAHTGNGPDVVLHRVRGQPALIPPTRFLLFSANGRRPVRDHVQSPIGNQAHGHREGSGQTWRA